MFTVVSLSSETSKTSAMLLALSRSGPPDHSYMRSCAGLSSGVLPGVAAPPRAQAVSQVAPAAPAAPARPISPLRVYPRASMTALLS
jgi:hypothetical protein